MGLDDLAGPGAWDTYEDKAMPVLPTAPSPAEPDQADQTEPVANGAGKSRGKIESASTPSGWRINAP
jgi:hypothetical protein